MATLTKPKKIDIADTNIAGLGTDLEKKVRLEAAKTEKAWEGVGQKVELKVWRIENFKVVPWPESDYGKFYNGDSYIVLNTWKKPDEPKLYHDIHFWLGRETSQDEAGTAAYKTVELDDFLGTLPVQHREVEGAESALFKSYFTELRIVVGGVESGFNHVKPEEYKPRLIHIHVNKKKPGQNITGLYIKEVSISYKSLNSGDVFVYDSGLKLLQWNGSNASGQEKVKAAEFVRKVSSARKGLATITVFDEGDADSAFFEAIGGRGPVSPPLKLKFKLEAIGKFGKKLLDSKDVFIVDGQQYGIFIWVGKSCSTLEKQSSMKTAMEYLKKENLPMDSSISRVLEGGENEAFFSEFDN
ncbi:hypothetical protein HDU92_009008 [Lobulomyces angularis]|nr:hypothetical protein HDU92_009008 [Lobulomyces angularis]